MKATKIPRPPPPPPPPPPSPAPAPVAVLEAPPAPPRASGFAPRPRPPSDLPPEQLSPSVALEMVRRPPRPEAIVREVCQVMAVDLEDLAGKTRHPRVVWARMIIIRLCRQYTTLSFPEIARLIGRPNHSTVITADQRTDEILKLPIESKRREVPILEAGAADIRRVLITLAMAVRGEPVAVVQTRSSPE